ncbi:hypothetical protein LHJ74_33110 [Streptomyces sp. N2-109]|uniref:Uncharacterized protein n=1 Tax=Streptomyces gossypii TaxID=2883101 RepID=A0ABT2K3H2_9ACTN|nr:hypothetical protein [Streptomyces gossypii]MCT2594698.1 hypothetical protein [Streptomyces gossypii]
MPMYGGVPDKDLEVEAESLKTFKTRVDSVLTELETSAASKGKVSAEGGVHRAAFGGNFNEADALFKQYNRVHTLLTTLSQTLNDQIEAMGIAVLGSKNDFETLDDDQKRRFWEIQARSEERYEDQRQDRRDRELEEKARLGEGQGKDTDDRTGDFD